MTEKLQTLKESLVSWTKRHAESAHAKHWLFGISFAESSFFPIPPDVLLVAILMTKERVKAFWYATITTAGSVLGGVFGYMLGFFFFQTFGVWLVNTYGLEQELVTVQTMFNDNAFFAIFVGAFTPIPYKLFTVAAGLFHVNLLVFVVASIVGRGLRFYAVAAVMKYWSKPAIDLFYKYANTASLFIVIFLALLAYLFMRG